MTDSHNLYLLPLLKKYVEDFVSLPKWQRVLSRIAKYKLLILAKKDKQNHRGMPAQANTFWGDTFHVLLPAAADIYLCGGKTHDSEIRLAKYLIRHLQAHHIVIDIGAHFGYFTLLAAHLAASGKVYAIEAAEHTFSVLSQNVASKKNITALHHAMSDYIGEFSFYEFPILYSEYNSLDRDQYRHESWFADIHITETNIPCTTIDHFCNQKHITPDFIKIDVEGAEDKVVEGAASLLAAHNTVVSVEYIRPKNDTGSSAHQRAFDKLVSLGKKPHLIDTHGQLFSVSNMDDYFSKSSSDSENVIFL